MDTKKELVWIFKWFGELTVNELYDILTLRSRVFVVEQQCIFLDMDGIDKQAHHLAGYADGNLVASTRILAKGIAYENYPSIGRVVTAPEARGKSYGNLLMKESISRLYDLYGEGPIKIGAQLYLKKFYENLGFQQSGEIYDEDGIDHIPMIKP